MVRCILVQEGKGTPSSDISLSLPAQSLSVDKPIALPPRWRHMVIEFHAQADMQGLGGGLPLDMRYDGTTFMWTSPDAHEQTPNYGLNSPCAPMVIRRLRVKPWQKPTTNKS